jgi:uncharacterized protein YjiS (DUF1127 family)
MHLTEGTLRERARFRRAGKRPLVRPVAAIAAALRRWQRRSRSRAELAEMDQRALNDLGLSRSHAIVEASKPFWRG